MRFEDDVKITLSAGVTCHCNKEEKLSEEELVKKVDDALYLAKQQGRNRVEAAA